MQAKQMSERVRDALSQLPDMQRDVLILRFYHTKDQRDCADHKHRKCNRKIQAAARDGKNEEGFGRGGMVDDTKRKETL